MRDTYQDIFAKYPTLTTFGSVVADEISMIATLKKLYAKYRLSAPPDTQVSAANTIAATTTGISNADAVAINLEQSTATLMTQLLQSADNQDVAGAVALIKTTSLGSHTSAFTAKEATVATPPTNPTTLPATTGQTFAGSGAPEASLGAKGDTGLTGATGPTGAIYGPDIAGNTLANAQIGGPASGASNTQVAFKFTATVTDTLVSFREHWIGKTHAGYGGGTGGTIRVTLQTDDGSGFPSGTILATKDIVSPPDDFTLYSFTSPPSLTVGKVYHLVHTNIDASPTVNFVSVDSVYCYGAVNSPRNACFTDAEYGQTAKYGSAPWEVRNNFTPILLLTYGGGITQGMGYMEFELATYATNNGATTWPASHLL